jgi:hypothetical protein
VLELRNFVGSLTADVLNKLCNLLSTTAVTFVATVKLWDGLRHGQGDHSHDDDDDDDNDNTQIIWHDKQ